MKHTFISFLLILFLIDIASGQTKYWEKLGQKFALCENDSVFLRRHSLLGYFPQEIDRGTGFLENYNDSFLFEMEPGCVYGPFVLDTMAIYVKIIRADSSIRMRVGHILLFPDSSRSMAQVKVLADSICTAVKKGADYDSMCRLYSMDGVRNRPQCDLSYFHQGVMVRPFEEAILKHNKGEVFTVQTEFGLHVVKNLEQPIKDRERLTYIMLYVSTRGHVVTNVGYSVFRRK